MLTGEKLGGAIEAAIKLKGVTKKEVAAHFGVQPPSIQDWVKRGTIGKEKLPKLWSYFSVRGACNSLGSGGDSCLRPYGFGCTRPGHIVRSCLPRSRCRVGALIEQLRQHGARL